MVGAANSNSAASFVRDLRKAVTSAIQDIEIGAYIRSREEISNDVVEVDVTGIRLTGQNGEASFKLVRAGADSITFTVLATVSIIARTTVTFSGWDDDHGKYNYEDTYLEQDDWFESDLLIELSTADLFPRISNVELVYPPSEIDFGEVESNLYYDARYK